MAGGSSVAIWRDMQTLFEAGTLNGLSDRQLLERFADRHEPAAGAEAAFEVLVRRHGPMVLRLCRNLLNDPNDAQDAFQATFLVLVQRCGAVRHFESLGGWLYGVAHRVAARARVEAARRRAVEGRAALRVVGAVEPAACDQPDRAEFGPIVQEEVRRLPECYRAVVVLCYWESLTQEQAAERLGCPLGTVRSRLARAREILLRRLTRRGLAPLAGVVAAGLSSATARAALVGLPAVPPELAQATIRSALRLAAGEAASRVVSGVVASLVQRVIWSTVMIKISSVAAGIMLIGLAGYGAGLAAHKAGQARSDLGRGGAEQQASGPADPLDQPRPKSPKSDKKIAPAEGQPKTAAFEAVYCNVQGQTVLLRAVPEGSVVRKGDILGKLDSAALQDSLVNQMITAKSAEANFQNAKLAREDAEWTLSTYTEDRFPRERRELEMGMKVAEAEMAVAEEELKAVKSTGGDNELAIKRAELAVARAKLAREQADNRRHILTEYTNRKTIRELTSEVEKAHSNELAKEATWELEISKAKKLERQIAVCTLIAPIDGTVVYAEFVREGSATGNLPRLFRIEQGATVRERQIIFRIVPNPRADSGNR
jgi:HlyD family secretion protein